MTAVYAIPRFVPLHRIARRRIASDMPLFAEINMEQQNGSQDEQQDGLEVEAQTEAEA